MTEETMLMLIPVAALAILQWRFYLRWVLAKAVKCGKAQ